VVAEQALLARLLRPEAAPKPSQKPADAQEPAPGVWLQSTMGPEGPRFTLSGPGLNEDFGTRLTEWLRLRA
jgi:hypothetical protein